MKLNVFDSYIIKNLIFVTLSVAVVLAAIIMLTQSLKFLELIINSGASGRAFWMLTFLALPRFFEIILPIALMISGLFIYNRMIGDSEIIVAKAAGKSPLQLAKPAILLSFVISLIVFFITTWLAPVSLAGMVQLRQVVKAQYSTLLFQAGVFNEIGNDLTVYIDNRNSKGELEGLLIYENRPVNPAPVTIIAKTGVVVSTDKGQQVLVYNGSRQDFNKKTGALNRLDFERYSLDLPESVEVGSKWKEPDERTFLELFNIDMNNADDVKYKREFIVEANRRIAGSFLPMTFTSIVLCFLLLGPLNRRGQMYRVTIAVITIIIIQSMFLSFASLALKSLLGLLMMYFVALVPLLLSFLALSVTGEAIYRQLVFNYMGQRFKEVKV